MPPTAPTVVSRPNPTGPRPRRSRRVEHEHRPRRPVGDVERDDRERQGADGAVAPRPPEALGDVAADVAAARPARAAAARTIREIEDGAERDAHGLDDERPRHARGEEHGADRPGRPAGSVAMPGRHQPGVADAEVRACHDHRQQRPRRSCRRTPRRCRAGTSSRGRRRRRPRPVTSAATRTASTDGAQQVDGDHEQPPVDPVGEDAGVQPEQQPRQALQQRRPARRAAGRRSATRRAAARRPARCRRRGCRSTTSRPASGTASPSGPGARLPRRGPRGRRP